VVGKNVAIVFGAGSTTTGDSAYGIDGSSATTVGTLPVRVVDVVPASANGPRNATTTGYYEFIVKLNTQAYNDVNGS
jgi:hypothetical protein